MASHIGIEEFQELCDLATRARGDELLDDLPFGDRLDDKAGRAAGVDVTARPARELTARGRRTSDDGCNALERILKDFVQHEHRAFSRAQLGEHDEERNANVVVERHPVCGVGTRSVANECRVLVRLL